MLNTTDAARIKLDIEILEVIAKLGDSTQLQSSSFGNELRTLSSKVMKDVETTLKLK